MFHDDYLLLASSYQLAKPPKLKKKEKKKVCFRSYICYNKMCDMNNLWDIYT